MDSFRHKTKCRVFINTISYFQRIHAFVAKQMAKRVQHTKTIETCICWTRFQCFQWMYVLSYLDYCIRQARVAQKQPTTGSDTIGLVLELVRPHFIEIVEAVIHIVPTHATDVSIPHIPHDTHQHSNFAEVTENDLWSNYTVATRQLTKNTLKFIQLTRRTRFLHNAGNTDQTNAMTWLHFRAKTSIAT